MNKDSQRSGFNLFLASDAVYGAMGAIYELMAEIPADGTEARTLWANALTGLAWSGRQAARDLNLFLWEASDRHRFPSKYSDIESDENEVREPTPIYAVQ